MLKIDNPSRIIKAFRFSLNGIRTAWNNEAAFRQESVCLVILIPLGLWLGESGLERAILVFVVLMVLLVELLNSAIEAVVDRIGTEHHRLSGNAKDLGSAAVLVAIAIAIAVWVLVLTD